MTKQNVINTLNGLKDGGQWEFTNTNNVIVLVWYGRMEFVTDTNGELSEIEHPEWVIEIDGEQVSPTHINYSNVKQVAEYLITLVPEEKPEMEYKYDYICCACGNQDDDGWEAWGRDDAKEHQKFECNECGTELETDTTEENVCEVYVNGLDTYKDVTYITHRTKRVLNKSETV